MKIPATPNAPAFWLMDKTPAGTPNRQSLTILNSELVGHPTSNHIVIDEERVTIQDVTIFAGHLTHMAAIRWGVRGLLKSRRWRRRARRTAAVVAAAAVATGVIGALR